MISEQLRTTHAQLTQPLQGRPRPPRLAGLVRQALRRRGADTTINLRLYILLAVALALAAFVDHREQHLNRLTPYVQQQQRQP